MKKILLVSSMAIGLLGCGSPIDEASEIAVEYCEAIKRTNFVDAKELAVGYVVDANERWFDKDNRKYRKVFGDQRCSIKNVDASEDEKSFKVYFSPSLKTEGSFVDIEYSDEKDSYVVTGDMFAVYQLFY